MCLYLHRADFRPLASNMKHMEHSLAKPSAVYRVTTHVTNVFAFVTSSLWRPSHDLQQHTHRSSVQRPPMPAGNNDAATGIAKAAKAAFEASQLIASSERVRALHEIRDQLVSAKADILAANKRDLEVHLALIPSYM